MQKGQNCKEHDGLHFRPFTFINLTKKILTGTAGGGGGGGGRAPPSPPPLESATGDKMF